MIVVQLQGGLGNQMFQYAAARALALRTDAPLLFDLRALQADPLRAYALDAFRVSGRPARCGELGLLQTGPGTRAVDALSSSALGRQLLALARQPRIHRSEHVHYDPEVLDLPSHVYLVGNFQSERYFAHIAQTIRQDFQPVGSFTPESRTLAQAIADCEGVSLHVRRTDYVDNPAVNATHGVLTPGHYSRCVARLAPRLSDPHYFVFSDDPDWAEANIRPPGPTTWVRPRTGGTDAEDMLLMSMCRHNIIANSSFSWWAAWLNPHPQKVVLAPARWFSDPRHDTRDIIPNAWEML